MKRITILALHLNYGGIEKFIANLANSISDDYDIEVVSTYKLLDKPFFDFNSNIKVKYLITDLKPNKDELKTSIKQHRFIKFIKELFVSAKILYLKKHLMINYIKKCDSDIIISTRDIHNKWLGKYGKDKTLKIGSEHNDIDSTKYIKKIAKTAFNLNCFVVVSKKMVNDYKKYLNIPVIYIPNSITTLPKSFSNFESNNIISVGRLEKIKAYEDLIDVFKIVSANNRSIILNIIGSGSELDNLNEKIKKLNLENNIKLLGYKNTKELYDLYNNSSIYVMTSISESFGIVLLEAMSHKLPCIAFDSANGACELICNNKNGYLIKNRDKAEMAHKILELIDNKDKCIKMGENSFNKSKEYLSKNIKQKWVDIFEK